jgi:death-on-curing protein
VTIRDLGLLESAVAQPKAAFSGKELYPTLLEKAAALCYFIVGNHPFVDGNKRVGHAAMETFLLLNSRQIFATVDEQEKLMLGIASGTIGRQQLVSWLSQHTMERTMD